MRGLSLILLAAGAATAPAPSTTEPPKATPKAKTYEELAPVVQPAEIINEKPLIKSNAKRQLVRYGPFDLPGLKPTPLGAMEHGHGGGGIMSGNPISGMNIWPLLRGDLIGGIADMLNGAMDPEGVQVSKTLQEGICKNCSILSSKIDAIFENGTRADLTSGVYLHHIIAVNGGTEQTKKNDLFHPWVDFCSGGGGSMMNLGMGVMSSLNRLFGSRKPDVFAFGAVDEFRQWFTTPDGSMDSGFYRGPNDLMFMQAELINYRPEAQKVYLQFDVEYVPGKSRRNAATMFTSATDCDKGIAFMGKGQGDQSGGELNVNADGLVLSARGHMHDGGESMTVYLNGKSVCTSNAEYGTSFEIPSVAPAAPGDAKGGGMASMADMAGHGRATAPLANSTKPNKVLTTISRMSDCLTTYPVKQGNKIKLVAHYNLEAHPLRESGGEAQMQMGLVAFTWVPT